MEVKELFSLSPEVQNAIEMGYVCDAVASYSQGKLLKELRADHGITQIEMSKLLGTSQSIVSKRENEAKPDDDYLNNALFYIGMKRAEFDLLHEVMELLELPSLRAFKRLSLDDLREELEATLSEGLKGDLVRDRILRRMATMSEEAMAELDRVSEAIAFFYAHKEKTEK